MRCSLQQHDIIVIGASSGGISVLQSLLSALPRRFPAAVFIVLHRAAESSSSGDILATVLTHRADIRAEVPTDGQPFEHGRVYVAPRDAHLVIDRGIMRLETGPRETRARARPSIDVLFRSAATTYTKRVVGVVLTGLLDDGMAGLWQIRKRGGITIVQDPAEAKYPSMPESAIKNVPVNYCLPLEGIAHKLIELAGRNVDADVGGAQPVRVLIVEDERLVALNLESRLSDLGYEVVGSVSSGQAALDTALLVSPDIALMDIKLSGTMKGTEAARLLWERSQVPSIFLTAYADEEVLREARLANPYGYIVKPFRPAQVHAAIQMALERFTREMRAD